MSPTTTDAEAADRDRTHDRGGDRADDGTDLDRAIAAFAEGSPVLIHDAADREGETDLVYPARAVTPAALAQLRNDAGGLVCVALSDAVATAWELPFTQNELAHPAAADHDLGYDERSSFSLTVNHRDTYTGITDEDRALTVSELGRSIFRAPGHVHLLRGAPNLLADRQGHTELGLALAAAAEKPPAVAVCEMLTDGGGALSPGDARAYAERNGLVYVEGASIIEHLG
ncbi:3,4-dihydroxy-2-butanone-4-phosphate synthase [Halobacteriales archaeon QS_3_64_16]|nr:MAG: 3,4-dihydroxy-2-butanone-4-phosphate synthase [Halobacteriales archaeon QS_3_64_16]